eukprot:scaffold211524_cov33-Prasinocladus_malaysianus.AAC.1
MAMPGPQVTVAPPEPAESTNSEAKKASTEPAKGPASAVETDQPPVPEAFAAMPGPQMTVAPPEPAAPAKPEADNQTQAADSTETKQDASAAAVAEAFSAMPGPQITVAPPTPTKRKDEVTPADAEAPDEKRQKPSTEVSDSPEANASGAEPVSGLAATDAHADSN